MPVLYKKTLLFITAILASTSSSAEQDCAAAWVSGRLDNAPLSSVEDEQLSGIGHSILLLTLPQSAAIQTTPPLPWPRTLNQAKAGKIDFIVGLHKSKQREEHYDFIEPALTTTVQSIFYLKDRKNMRTWDDLKPLQGGILRGSQFGTEFTSYAKEHLSVSEIGNVKQGIMLLTDHKRIDYFIAPLLPTIHYVQNNFPTALSSLSFLKKPAAVTAEYIAMSKKSGCLQHKKHIQENLNSLIEDGTFDAMLGAELEKWQAIDWYLDNIRYR